MARSCRVQSLCDLFGGALVAVCFCWAAVSLYFFRRYTLSAWIAPVAVVILLVYKIAVIGW
jgi:hypothetical protein